MPFVLDHGMFLLARYDLDNHSKRRPRSRCDADLKPFLRPPMTLIDNGIMLPFSVAKHVTLEHSNREVPNDPDPSEIGGTYRHGP